MLLEMLSWGLTPCSWRYRRWGYLSENIATWARYRRHRYAWEPHLRTSKRFIRNALKRLDSDMTIRILGSGNFLDIPLDALERFQRVECWDVVHSLPARFKIRKNKNVFLVEADVSGALDLLGTDSSELPPVSAVFPFQDEGCFVISLNLLSQLGLMPGDILEKRGFDEAEVGRWQEALMKAHWDAMQAYAGRGLLISDVSVREIIRPNQEGEFFPLIPFELPRADAEWDWHACPFGEIEPDKAFIRQVKAWRV